MRQREGRKALHEVGTVGFAGMSSQAEVAITRMSLTCSAVVEGWFGGIATCHIGQVYATSIELFYPAEEQCQGAEQ
jgi:hypothetical protein